MRRGGVKRRGMRSVRISNESFILKCVLIFMEPPKIPSQATVRRSEGGPEAKKKHVRRMKRP